jgi:hypothetical protein
MNQCGTALFGALAFLPFCISSVAPANISHFKTHFHAPAETFSSSALSMLSSVVSRRGNFRTNSLAV